MRMESFQTSLFFSLYNLILLSSPFTKSASLSITGFLFANIPLQVSPPVLVRFGEHRVVGHQRCFQLFFSHLLQAEVCKTPVPEG